MRQQLAVLFALITGLLGAQSPSREDPAQRPSFLVGSRLHYGFIIPHSKDIAQVSKSSPYGLELNLQWLFSDEKHTRSSGVVAKRGILAYYLNYDNPDVLGYCVGLAPYVEPLIRPDRRLFGSFQMGLGLAYTSKVYDEQRNPTNLFFSTPVSFLVFTNAYLNFRASAHWELSVGFNYNHISNGGMKTPNKGMNFPTYNAGAAYNFRPRPMVRPVKTDDWKRQSRFYRYVQAVGSIKTAEATNDFPENKSRWLLGAIGVAGWRIGRMSALAAGAELIHDGWTRENLDRVGDDTNAWKGGFLAGHELIVGKVRFTTHMGIYAYNPSRQTDLLYQRYGLFYRFGQHLQVGSTLKAHRHVADVFDLRAGWIW